MQTAESFPLDISTIAREEELASLVFGLSPGDRIFFFGDLGSGKSTFIREILRSYFQNPKLRVRSPTYTYFEKYGNNIFHFDLYRLTSLEDFFLIGGEDIFLNPENICLVEWPEILGNTFVPTKSIFLEKISENQRKISYSSPLKSTDGGQNITQQ